MEARDSYHEYILNIKSWVNIQKPLSKSDLSRIVMLDFWTFCCADCLNLLPELEEIEQSLGEKLLVIGVHSGKFDHEKSSNAILNAIFKYNIKHPVINDADFRIWNDFKVQAWPTIIILRPDGSIYKRYGSSRNRIILENERVTLKEDIYKLLNNIEIREPDKDIKFLQEERSLLYYPSKIKALKNNLLAISDSGNNRILITDHHGNLVCCINHLDLNFPQGVGEHNDILYICDTHNNYIKYINLKNGEAGILAGNASRGSSILQELHDAKSISLNLPWDIEIQSDVLMFANAGSHQIAKINLVTNQCILYAGNGNEDIIDGDLINAELAQPSALFLHNDILYLIDSETNSLRFIKDNQIQTLVGTGLFDFGLVDGIRNIAKMQHPLGLCIDKDNIYIADAYNNKIRVFSLQTKSLSTLDIKDMNEPSDVTILKNQLYITDSNNHKIQKYDLASRSCTEFTINFSPDFIKIARKAKLNIILPHGHKLNEEMLSSVILYDATGNVLYSFSVQEFIDFPELEIGDYILKTQLYYCLKDGGMCSIFMKTVTISVTDNAWGILSLMII